MVMPWPQFVLELLLSSLKLVWAFPYLDLPWLLVGLLHSIPWHWGEFLLVAGCVTVSIVATLGYFFMHWWSAEGGVAAAVYMPPAAALYYSFFLFMSTLCRKITLVDYICCSSFISSFWGWCLSSSVVMYICTTTKDLQCIPGNTCATYICTHNNLHQAPALVAVAIATWTLQIPPLHPKFWGSYLDLEVYQMDGY